MQKAKSYFLIISISLLFAAHLLAFVGSIQFDKDIEGNFEIPHQFCFINHNKGIQHTILMLNPPEEYDSEQPVYIFPVKANPDSIRIGITNQFPVLDGANIRKVSKWILFSHFNLLRGSQIYTIPLMMFPELNFYLQNEATEMDIENEFLLDFERTLKPVTCKERIKMTGLTNKLLIRDKAKTEEIEIKKKIERMGITTELVSAKDIESLSNYVKKHNLNLTDDFKKILNNYIKNGFSLLVYGITDIQKYKKAYLRLYFTYLLDEGNILEAKKILYSQDLQNQSMGQEAV